MELSLDAIKSITCGAEDVSLEDGYFKFFRYTKEQSEIYIKNGYDEFYQKIFAGASIRLAMYTDADKMSFDYRFKYAARRQYGWFDVYENGTLIQHIGGEYGEFDGCADIKFSSGIKLVEIHFPWSRSAELANVRLEGAKIVKAAKRKYNMICYGDSITQGCDALYTSGSYVSLLAKMLNADCCNKGIGNQCYFPSLLDAPEPIKPDLVTVSYGTNDRNYSSFLQFVTDCKGFAQKAANMYTGIPVFIITPLWTANISANEQFKIPLDKIYENVCEICMDFDNITVVDGYGMLPHNADYLCFDGLHPNDLGFSILEKIFTNLLLPSCQKNFN